MIYIDIDDNLFYDDAVVLVKSFYPRTDVGRYLADTVLDAQDIVIRADTSNLTCCRRQPLILQESALLKNDASDTDRSDSGKGADKHGDVIGIDRIYNSTKRQLHDAFKRRLYDELSTKTGKSLPWGYMTGVRPSKNAYILLEQGKCDDEIIDVFTKTHYVNIDKAKLALTVAKNEMKILNSLDYKNGYSLYIGIPFCPSICMYCSFSSSAISVYKNQVDAYLKALYKELNFVSNHFKDKHLESVYIGGGTPTSISAPQLDELLTYVENAFDVEYVREFTVEAGRPDSITRDKLEVLMKHRVSRISINPQTMNQSTLDLIGRKHTVEQVRETFLMARNIGLHNINMDIILGLPGEGLAEVSHTLDEIIDLRPESLTVHSLAIKRAAALNIWKEQYKNLTFENTEQIIHATYRAARQLDMEPYYMYRQKNMAGNFENVGFARQGLECIYNILIMEEKQTIIACGAGASSKIVFYNSCEDELEAGSRDVLETKVDSVSETKSGNVLEDALRNGMHDTSSVRIERIENVKDVRNYIERIDEMILRKKDFFKEYGI